jgi:hypothetical protein
VLVARVHSGIPFKASSVLQRFYAAFLAAAFISGIGLPDADALLYYSRSPIAAEVSHYDQPGGCGSHAEHCVLAVAASLRQLATGVFRLPELGLEAPQSLIVPRADAPRPAERTNLQRSRAAPAAS